MPKPETTKRIQTASIKAAPLAWHAQSRLFHSLPGNVLKILEIFPEILKEAWPLNSSHRRSLPRDIRELSQALTSHRFELKYHYWSKPGWISAYLYYFLPWNLVRLCSLFVNFPFPDPVNRGNRSPLLLDAGSGPLTLPIALWLTHPSWRSLPISVFALDSAKQPLEIGARVFRALAEKTCQPSWNVTVKAGSLHKLDAMVAADFAQSNYPWLITAANTLNELNINARASDDASSEESLLMAWEPLWQTGAPLLFIEPGTRMGSTAIMRMREAALANGLRAISPCAHNNPCPMLTNGPSSLSQKWCHFLFSAQEAPEWLKRLSREAGLYKTSLSLSLLFISQTLIKKTCPPDALRCRVISQPFPTQAGKARYGCAACGLTLLPHAISTPSGSLCLAAKPLQPEKDAKSGAVILSPYENRHSPEDMPRKTYAPHPARSARTSSHPQRGDSAGKKIPQKIA